MRASSRTCASGARVATVPRTAMSTKTISPIMAAHEPTTDGQIEECRFGHIPMAAPIPSGMATRSTSSTTRTTSSFLVMGPSLIRSGAFGGPPG